MRGRLLNDVVRPQQERRRDRQAEGFRRPHVYNQIKSGRLLDGDLARLRPAQNFVDKVRGATPQIREVGSIGHQASLFGVLAIITNCQKSRPQRQRVDLSPIGEEEWVGDNKKSVRTALERVDSRRYVLKSPNFDGGRL